jgi:DNA-binding LytR/AlgR family response regulator
VTAYDEYALQAFEAAAVDYLLKPLKLERLQRTVDRLKTGGHEDRLPQAVQQLAPPRPAQPLRWLRASQGEMTHQVDVQDAGTRRDDASRLFVRFKGLSDELPVSRAYVPRFRAM